ncbi:VapE domain-containing protein [Variovorax sp. LG9.2]|uniref:VapE domain-containing protein n=1 Tax=Variovorax sp. LG9.2 TaxID=3048626 RepID=UPI002B22C53F|nr:VapE domain-containing protein [Variovorax sp. LG9.2]MEB0056492.1 VapE family protein [Variovorax sp. LG9.2]
MTGEQKEAPLGLVHESRSTTAPDRRRELTVRFTKFENYFAKTKSQYEMSFADLARRVQNAPVYPTKASCPLIVLATFGSVVTDEGSLRHTDNVVEITGVALDYDDEVVTIEEGARRLRDRGVAAVLHTTGRHSPDKPRWRALLPFSIPHSPAKLQDLASLANGAVGGIAAVESATLSQSFHIGRVQGVPYEYIVVEGTPIDLQEMFITSIPVKTSPKRSAAANDNEFDLLAPDERPKPSLSIIAFAAAAIPNDGVHPQAIKDWNEWRDIVFAIKDGAGEAGLEVALEFSRRHPKFDQREFDDRWRRSKYKLEGIGVGTLLARAGACGWADPRHAAPSAEGFEDVPVLATSLPHFTRKKDGTILATIGNLLEACRRPDICDLRLGHDTFKDELMCARPYTDEWRQFNDADYTWLRDRLARHGFAEVAKEAIRDAVHAIAEEHEFDSAILWIESLVWDGVKRVGTFLSTYAGAGDTPYTHAVSRYLWTALAGRVLQPGCKVDMAPVLVGAQGARKSSLVVAMVESMEHYVEVDLREKDDNLSRRMRGCLIAELGELQGMGAREIESVKAFITRSHENWVPKFKEFKTTFPRRLVFIGTTNKDQFLSDETGNRRWLPVRVETMCDPDSVARDRLQLWAEAASMFCAEGVCYKDAERLAVVEHVEFVEVDVWCETIATWLASPGPDMAAGVTTWQVACGALAIEKQKMDRAKETRIGKALKTMGFARKRMRIEGVLTYVYTRAPTVLT